MRAIGKADRLRAEVTRKSDVEVLLPYFPPHVSTFEMDLHPSRALSDDSSLDLLLYFANRMNFEDIVIERYGSDVLDLAERIAKKFSCGFAGKLDVLVVPKHKTSFTRNVETTIALNIRRPDGRRFVAMGEGRGMRLIIGDDRAVNERMSGRKDYNALLPLFDRGSSEFEELRQAVYETLSSLAVGYSSLSELLHDIRKDYDIIGEQAAQRFAYKSFIDFLQSAEMKTMVNVTKDSSGRTIYEAIPTAENMHLRWEQQKSVVNVAERYAKKARNEASDASRKVRELERRLHEVPDLERRVRELDLQVLQRDDTIRHVRVALAEAESKIECFCCKDRPIEVVFNCGHGACQVCTDALTTEERPAPGTNQFSANGPKIRARKVDPNAVIAVNLSTLASNFTPSTLKTHAGSHLVNVLKSPLLRTLSYVSS